MQMVTWLISLLAVLAVDFSAADSLFRAGRVREARNSALELETRAEADRDTVNLIKAWCLLGEISLSEGDDLKAAEYYIKCHKASSYVPDLTMLESSLYSMAQFYRKSGDPVEACKYIDRSIAFCELQHRGSMLALRLQEAADIHLAMGDSQGALRIAERGLEIAYEGVNNNIISRLLMEVAECKQSLGDTTAADALYHQAAMYLETLTRETQYLPKAYQKIGLSAERHRNYQAAADAYAQMLHIASTGRSHMMVLEANRDLARVYEHLDAATAAEYARAAERMSFVDDVAELANELAISQLELPRRERDLRIKKQERRIFRLGAAAILLAMLLTLLAHLFFSQLAARRRIERQNKDLVRLNLQKDQLIQIASEDDGKRRRSAVEQIRQDEVELPEIELTARQRGIIVCCCRGMTNKEIADSLDISVRTVETHKANIFKKLGISTSVELVTYAYKAGIIEK